MTARAGRMRRTRGKPSQTIAPELNLTTSSRQYEAMTERRWPRRPFAGLGRCGSCASGQAGLRSRSATPCCGQAASATATKRKKRSRGRGGNTYQYLDCLSRELVISFTQVATTCRGAMFRFVFVCRRPKWLLGKFRIRLSPQASESLQTLLSRGAARNRCGFHLAQVFDSLWHEWCKQPTTTSKCYLSEVNNQLAGFRAEMLEGYFELRLHEREQLRMQVAG